MNKPRSSRAHRPSRWALLSVIGLLVGCQGEGGSGESGSVCPTCIPQTGGDSGDFPGDMPSRCVPAFERVPVSDAEAVALGYDAPELRRRLVRPIESAMVWRLGDLRGGAPARGYDTETRVEASVTAADFISVRPNPEHCDATTCRSPTTGETFSISDECPSSVLRAPISVTFRTQDGAVSGTATGSAYLRPRGEWDLTLGAEPDWFEAHARADLHDVQGSLRLFPPFPDREHSGYVYVRLQLYAGKTAGELSPLVVERMPADPFTSSDYGPILGTFPPPDVLPAPRSPGHDSSP
jgi:hypothetical protein